MSSERFKPLAEQIAALCIRQGIAPETLTPEMVGQLMTRVHNRNARLVGKYFDNPQFREIVTRGIACLLRSCQSRNGRCRMSTQEAVRRQIKRSRMDGSWYGYNPDIAGIRMHYFMLNGAEDSITHRSVAPWRSAYMWACYGILWTGYDSTREAQ